MICVYVCVRALGNKCCELCHHQTALSPLCSQFFGKLFALNKWEDVCKYSDYYYVFMGKKWRTSQELPHRDHEVGLWLTFIVKLDRHCFAISKEKGPRPRWTTNKHVLDKLRKFLSVGNSGFLSVVVVVCLYPRSILHQFL